MPSIDAQASLIRAALKDANIEPDALDAIEAHGTGTALGDPIEIGGLKQVFDGREASLNPLLITSVKSKIGHLEAAAGIAGLVSSVLALERGQIPGNAQLQRQNRYIDLAGTSLALVRDTCSWPAKTEVDPVRRIGVSSFGFGGTNASLILRSVDS